MREMSWTLAEYEAAPALVVEEIYLFMCTERRARADLMKRQKNDA